MIFVIFESFALKDAPRPLQDAPRPLQDAPRPLQDAQKPLEDHPMIRSKTLQDPPQGTAKATPPQDHSKTISHSDLGLDLVLNTKPGTKSGTLSYARHGNRSPCQSVPRFVINSIRNLVTEQYQVWYQICC